MFCTGFLIIDLTLWCFLKIFIFIMNNRLYWLLKHNKLLANNEFNCVHFNRKQGPDLLQILLVDLSGEWKPRQKTLRLRQTEFLNWLVGYMDFIIHLRRVCMVVKVHRCDKSQPDDPRQDPSPWRQRRSVGILSHCV